MPPSPVSIVGKTVTWHCPTSLPELLRLKAAHPDARIVAGNTEVCMIPECILFFVCSERAGGGPAAVGEGGSPGP